MNPFTIGQHLNVLFGTRQRWQVAALSNTRCAMRMASTVTPATLWFTVEDLLRWNPEQQPKTQPVLYLLPAPRPVMFGLFHTQHIEMQHLKVGDILLHGPLGHTVMVCALGQIYDTHPLKGAPHFTEKVRFGVLQDMRTKRKWAHEFRNCGHGGEPVIGRAG